MLAGMCQFWSNIYKPWPCSSLCSSISALRETHILLPMEFSSAYGFPSVRWDNIYFDDPLLEYLPSEGKLRDWVWGPLKSISYRSENTENYLWVFLSGLWKDMKKTQASGSLCLTNKETWPSLNEGICLGEEHICIKSKNSFCRWESWQLIGLQ